MSYEFDSFKKSRVIGATSAVVSCSAENENLLDLGSRKSGDGRELQDIVRAVVS